MGVKNFVLVVLKCHVCLLIYYLLSMLPWFSFCRTDLKLSRDFESLTIKDEKGGVSEAGHDANTREDLPAHQLSLQPRLSIARAGPCRLRLRRCLSLVRPTLASSDPLVLHTSPAGPLQHYPFVISLQCPALPPTAPGSMCTFTTTAGPHLLLPPTARTEDENEADGQGIECCF